MSTSKRLRKDAPADIDYVSSVFDYIDEFSLSEVSKASILGSAEDLSRLIKSGKTVSCCTNQGQTPLHLAAEHGNLECCKILIEESDTEINALTFNGISPLMLGAQSDNMELVKLILSAGADPSTMDINGNSCLDYAFKNKNIEIFKLLMTNMDINIGSFEGWTIAHSIAKDGNFQFLKLLIETRVCKFDATDYGITPLHLACQEGNYECVKLLIDHNAGLIEKKADDGITPIFLAAQNDHLEILKLLLSYGADVNHVTQNGTVLHFAVMRENLECIETILTHGADVEGAIGETDVETPLGQAVFNNCLKTIEVLLQYGADPICCSSDPYSSTPLHLCFQNLESELNVDTCKILKLLVEHVKCQELGNSTVSDELALVLTNSDNCDLVIEVSIILNWSLQALISQEVLHVIITKSRVKTLSCLISSNYSFSSLDIGGNLAEYIAMSTAGQDSKHLIYQALYDQYLIIPRSVYHILKLRKDPITSNPMKVKFLSLIDRSSCQPRSLIDFCRFKIRSLLPCAHNFEQLIASLNINSTCKEILILERNCIVPISDLKTYIMPHYISENELQQQYMVM